jgi:hypothetical protein
MYVSVRLSVAKARGDKTVAESALPASDVGRSPDPRAGGPETPPTSAAESDKMLACRREGKQNDELVESSSPQHHTQYDDVLSAATVIPVPVPGQSNEATLLSSLKSFSSTAVSSLANMSRRILGYSDVTSAKPVNQASYSRQGETLASGFADMFSEDDNDRQLEQLNVRIFPRMFYCVKKYFRIRNMRRLSCWEH